MGMEMTMWLRSGIVASTFILHLEPTFYRQSRTVQSRQLRCGVVQSRTTGREAGRPNPRMVRAPCHANRPSSSVRLSANRWYKP